MGESVPSVQIADEPALSASLKLNLMTAERRSSSRHAGKTRPFYGSPEKKISGNTNISKPVVKKMKLNVGKAKEDKEDLVKLRNKEVSDPPTILFSAEAVDARVDGCEEKVVSEGVANDDNVADSGGKSADQRVRETIRLFNTHYLQLVQEEELRCRRANTDVISTCKDVNSKRKKSSEEDEKRSAKRRPDLKRKKSREEDEKRSAKRPDLKAITKMRETKTVLYPTKRFGALPGVDVGHQFYSRAEMVVVGLHSHWLNGIDFMGQTYAKLEEYKSKNYVFPLATSIVLSGIYEDDVDDSEDIVYTGQGGNDLLGCKHQISDQTMLRGNLALKNNMEHSVPVRVIRGHGCASSYTGKVYTYDGLYKVIKYWAEKGVSGFTVFKYRLRRMEGQGVLTTNQVLYVKAEAPKSLSELRGLVCEDISGGQENIKVPASNVVDDPPIPPMGYEYRKSIQVAEGVSLPTTANGCNCKGSCIDPRICACAQLNGSDFPYVSKDGGRLIEAKAVVYECGPKCGCGPGCVNRTSQQGLKYRLEVFRTSNKGWAVRSWDFIPAGAPICEYTGRLMPTNDLDKVENVSGNNFIFEIDCLQTMKGIDGRESRSGGSTLLSSLDKTECVPEYCIDAGPVGGVARFINHSCEPNLFVQCILSAHHDVKLARVVLFAADSIPPLQELTYDYGYVLGSVTGPDGKIKEMPCYCGAKLCRKRLY